MLSILYGLITSASIFIVSAILGGVIHKTCNEQFMWGRMFLGLICLFNGFNAIILFIILLNG